MKHALFAAAFTLVSAGLASAQQPESPPQPQPQRPSYTGLQVREGECVFFDHPRKERHNSPIIGGIVSSLIASGVDYAVGAVRSAAEAREAAISASTSIVLARNAPPRCFHVMHAEFGASATEVSTTWTANTIYSNVLSSLRPFAPTEQPRFFAEIAILHYGDGTFRAVPTVVHFQEPQFRRFLRPSSRRTITLSFTIRAPAGDDEKKAISFNIPLGPMNTGEPRRFTPCSALIDALRRPMCAGVIVPASTQGDQNADSIDYDGVRFIGETAPFTLPLAATPKRWVLEATLTEVQGASRAVAVAASLLEGQEAEITSRLQQAALEDAAATARAQRQTAEATARQEYGTALAAAITALDTCATSATGPNAQLAVSRMLTANAKATPAGETQPFANPNVVLAQSATDRANQCRRLHTAAVGS